MKNTITTKLIYGFLLYSGWMTPLVPQQASFGVPWEIRSKCQVRLPIEQREAELPPGELATQQ
jgi:hypothetical protein